LYVGVTNDIERRDYEHKNRSIPGFTSKYRLDRMVYFEGHADIREAIEREKQIKSWRREKKLAQCESLNPKWRDLSLDWHLDDLSQPSDKSLRVDPSAAPQKNAALVGMTKRTANGETLTIGSVEPTRYTWRSPDDTQLRSCRVMMNS
jgi:putative endonuclease